jgi:hypothetical protein
MEFRMVLIDWRFEGIGGGSGEVVLRRRGLAQLLAVVFKGTGKPRELKVKATAKGCGE